MLGTGMAHIFHISLQHPFELFEWWIFLHAPVLTAMGHWKHIFNS
jgi:hypothetical protein